jgi:hypothetical protein
MALDILRLVLIHTSQFVAGIRRPPQKLVHLRVNRLSVAMRNSLDEERHRPYCEDGPRVPIESVRFEVGPASGIGRNDHDRERAGGGDAQCCKGSAKEGMSHVSGTLAAQTCAAWPSGILSRKLRTEQITFSSPPYRVMNNSTSACRAPFHPCPHRGWAKLIAAEHLEQIGKIAGVAGNTHPKAAPLSRKHPVDPKTQDFASSLALSNSYTDSGWWTQIYRRAFPTLISAVSVREDGSAQRGRINRVLTLSCERVYTVDEKVRSNNSPDILL